MCRPNTHAVQALNVEPLFLPLAVVLCCIASPSVAANDPIGYCEVPVHSVQLARLRVIVAGDANNDGQFDQADIEAVVKAIAEKGVVLGNGDCNVDGLLNVQDLACINTQRGQNGLDRVLFVYDEAGHLIGEYLKNGASFITLKEYVWLGDLPVAVLAGGQIYRVLADHLGTPREILDSADRWVWSWQPDPFGALAPQEDPDQDGKRFVFNLRFPGQYYDIENGLHYNVYRTYDPTTGRYLEPDPIGLAGGVNLYSYAAGNPSNYTDPSGRIIPLIIWGVGAGLFVADIITPPSLPAGHENDAIVASAGPGEALGVIAGGARLMCRGVQSIAERAITNASSEAKSTSQELTTFFPPNNGFLGTPVNTTLQPGQIIDRFGGSEVSRFFSPTGTPAAMRALPPGTQPQLLRTFEVLKPIDVQAGQVAPAFNQIGLGTQFRSNQQLGELLEQGFLKEITK